MSNIPEYDQNIKVFDKDHFTTETVKAIITEGFSKPQQEQHQYFEGIIESITAEIESGKGVYKDTRTIIESINNEAFA